MNGYAICRRHAGITQEDAALQLHVDRSSVAKWETGCAQPRVEVLIRMARLYGCTVDELVMPRETESAV